MPYIKKNVNILLLLLIIVALGAMAGLTTYYQTTYKNLSQSYNIKLKQLNDLNNNLSTQQSQLRQLNEELEVKSAVKEKFDVLYTNITDFNEKISGDLRQTSTELAETLRKLKTAEADLSSAQSELNSTQAALKTQLQYTGELQLSLEQKNSQICTLKQRLNETC